MINSILDFVCSTICTAIVLLLGIVLIIGSIILIVVCVGVIVVYLCTGEIIKSFLCLLALCLITAIWIVVLDKI